MTHIIKASVLRAALSCISLMASGQNVANAKNLKVVSFNLCADQLALEFGNIDQVLGLSSMARNPALSYHWKLATAVPAIRASAEAALQLAPEIVFIGQYDARYTKAVLVKAGMKTYSIPAWKTLAETRAGVIDAAAQIGQKVRGEELVSDIDRSLRRLEGLRVHIDEPRSFLIFQRRGYAQKGGVVAEVLSHAGLRDASDEFGLPSAGGFVPLEKLVETRPDYLVVSEAIAIAEDQGQALLLHPAITRLYPPKKMLIIPDALSICAGSSTPALIDQVLQEIEAKVILK